MNRTTVMEGSLAEFDLMSVMQVVSIGRQFTGLELRDERGVVVGSLSLKSGKILAARAGARSGMEAIRALIGVTPRHRFFVYRADPPREVPPPIGSVADVLLRVSDLPPLPAEEPVLVMEGTLDEFDLASVIQVVSLGRQLVAIEVREASGVPIGEIRVKGGMVISARKGSLEGAEAARALLKAPRDGVFVVRRYPPDDRVTALGTFTAFLLDDDAAPIDDDADWEDDPTEMRPAAAPHAPRPAPLARADALPMVPLFEPKTSPYGFPLLHDRVGVPVIAVTSPKGGAGATTIALNLAVVLARRGKRVVLVDTDVNGVALSLDVQRRFARGAHDVMAGDAELRDVLVPTRIPSLRLLPCGTPRAARDGAWADLVAKLRGEADVVIVDTPHAAGGGTSDALAASTHALLVLPAEPASLRAYERWDQPFAGPGRPGPKLLGIVLNMLDYRARASIEVLRRLCDGGAASWVFEVPIPRSPAFMEATAHGVPICPADSTSAPTIAWVFEMLATSVLERLGMQAPMLRTEKLLS